MQDRHCKIKGKTENKKEKEKENKRAIKSSLTHLKLDMKTNEQDYHFSVERYS